MHEVDSEYEPNSLEEDIHYTPRKRNRRTRRGEFDSTTESEVGHLHFHTTCESLEGTTGQEGSPDTSSCHISLVMK